MGILKTITSWLRPAGRDPELVALQEQIERRSLMLQAKLLESQLGNWIGDIVDPREPVWDDPEFWMPFNSGLQVPPTLNKTMRGELLPVYINWFGLKLIRDQCRWIAANNEFAINAMANRQNYVFGKGLQVTLVPKTGKDGPEAKQLADEGQAWIDSFKSREVFNEKEREAGWRCDRDGEAFLRLFHTGGGQTAARFVEPEWVMSPSEQEDNTYGVVTAEGDVEDVLGYWVIENPPDPTPTYVPAEEVVHIKLNSDSTSKRGLPTLFAVKKNLERADKLLRNMSTLAQVQSTFALIRRHKQYSLSAVQAFQQNQADRSYANPISGNTQYMQKLQPGSIVDVPDNTEYEFPASQVNAGALVQILQAELRAIASRLCMPEYMLTADASNANYSSTMVAESPAVRNFEQLQSFFARAFGDGECGQLRRCGVFWIVLHNAVLYGGLNPAVLTDCELQVEGPTLAVRDKSQETNRAKTLQEKGILSKSTWAKWEGLDYDQEQKLGAKEEKPGSGGPGGPFGPGGGSGPGPDDGGEGGGDLGGQSDGDLGGGDGQWIDREGLLESHESLLVSEGFTGTIKDALGRLLHYVNGKRVAGDKQDAAKTQTAHKATTTTRRPKQLSATVDPAAQKEANELFGKHVAGNELANLAGAQSGSRTVVKMAAFGTLTLLTKGEGYEMRRSLFKTKDGKLAVDNERMDVHGDQRGLGTRIFADQVDALAKAGVDRIYTAASGEVENGKRDVGYFVWPKLGYDGEIPEFYQRKLPAEWKGVKTIQELYAKPGGDSWWQKNGGSIDLVFDVKDGSKSRQLLASYLKKKGIVLESVRLYPVFMDHEHVPEALERQLQEAGFTGVITDRLGRKIHYQDGRRVKGPTEGGQPTTHQRAPETKQPVSFSSAKEAHAWGEKHFRTWAESLSQPEKSALEEYQADHGFKTIQTYQAVNQALRHPEDTSHPGNAQGKKWLAQHKQALDNAIYSASVPENILVHRGIGSAAEELLQAFDEDALQPGTRFQDRGYISTSLTADSASNFSGPWGIKVEIRVLKGSPCAYMDAVSNHGEQELLLPRNSIFEVVKAYRDEGGGRRLLVEYLPQPLTESLLSRLSEATDGDDERRQGKYAWQDGDLHILPAEEDAQEGRLLEAQHGEGEKFQGPSGRWFVISRGRAVPTAAPADGKSSPAARQQADQSQAERGQHLAQQDSSARDLWKQLKPQAGFHPETASANIKTIVASKLDSSKKLEMVLAQVLGGEFHGDSHAVDASATVKNAAAGPIKLGIEAKWSEAVNQKEISIKPDQEGRKALWAAEVATKDGHPGLILAVTMNPNFDEGKQFIRLEFTHKRLGVNRLKPLCVERQEGGCVKSLAELGSPAVAQALHNAIMEAAREADLDAWKEGLIQSLDQRHQKNDHWNSDMAKAYQLLTGKDLDMRHREERDQAIAERDQARAEHEKAKAERDAAHSKLQALQANAEKDPDLAKKLKELGLL